MARFNGVENEKGKQKVEFRIEANLGTIAHNPKTNWNKEVNIVKWNDGVSKLDIREWDAKHERMSKGVTFNENEAGRLTNILSRCFPEDCYRKGERYQDVQPSNDVPFEETVDSNHQEEMVGNIDEDLPSNELPDLEAQMDYEYDCDRAEVEACEIQQDEEIAG